MIAHDRISAVVCSTDLERSREFYEQKLGLTLSAETVPNHLLFEAGYGTTLLVYGRPSPNLADHTQVRFWCVDVAADVSELVGRGMEFDLVEFGDFKMADHVLTTPVGKSAWIKDRMATRSRCFSPPSSTEDGRPAATGSTTWRTRLGPGGRCRAVENRNASAYRPAPAVEI